MDSLDALLHSALSQAGYGRKVKKMPDAPRPKAETFHQKWANPDNWRKGAIVALIHRSTSGSLMLLGSFQELIHRDNQSRRLDRLSEPAIAQREEFVTGDWWLPKLLSLPPAEPESPEALPVEDREVFLDIDLESIGVQARNERVVVRLERGWIRRVTLVHQTKFVCPTAKSVIYLPKGTDVLEGMSFACKVALKNKIGAGR